MKLLIVLSLLTSSVAMAKTQQCKDIKTCISLVSELTDIQYIIDKDVKGSFDMTKNYTITKENAEAFLSHALYMTGYTKVPTNKNEWTVINARDVRYVSTPTYNYPKEKVPETFDHVMVTIKLKNKYIVSDISRNFRPFMSRYGRIIDLKRPGIIIISDTGKNINRLLKMIELIDYKPSEDEIEALEQEKKNNLRLRMIKAQNCKEEKK